MFKRVEHTQMVDKLYESFVFACFTATKEAIQNNDSEAMEHKMYSVRSIY